MAKKVFAWRFLAKARDQNPVFCQFGNADTSQANEG